MYSRSPQIERPDLPELKWFKGNIHTHTTESDGDDTPENVVRWYRRHGYDFLVLSDHNHLTLFEYAAGRRRFKRPLMVPGEEVTLSIHEGRTPIHINAIGISRVVEPIDAREIVPTHPGQRRRDHRRGRHRVHQPPQLPLVVRPRSHQGGNGRHSAGDIQRPPRLERSRSARQGELRGDMGRRTERRANDIWRRH